MKKFLAAALVGASMFAVAPAQAVTLISTTTEGTGSSLVTFYTYSATFIDNGDGTGAVDLGSVQPSAAGSGNFVIRYQFVTPTGFLTSSGNSASTRFSTDVDFGAVTSNAIVYGPVKLNGVFGQIQNETGNVGNSTWKWPDGALVGTANPNVLEVSGHQNGTGRITGEVSFMAVPEPATWALMVMGFGLVGVSMRNRRRSVVAA